MELYAAPLSEPHNFRNLANLKIKFSRNVPQSYTYTSIFIYANADLQFPSPAYVQVEF